MTELPGCGVVRFCVMGIISGAAGGPSFLPRNATELFVWLALVAGGAFVGRFFVVFAYRVANQA